MHRADSQNGLIRKTYRDTLHVYFTLTAPVEKLFLTLKLNQGKAFLTEE
jgi:hypothetical protein